MPRRIGFSKKKPPSLPVVLTIAGSDSGGGAGIQADLKTFNTWSVFGTSAITCITAQNPDAVTGIQAINRAIIAEQIRAVTRGFPVAAAKTGMLFSQSIIRTVAHSLRAAKIHFLVVDPVMIATSGARLLKEDAIEALIRELLPLATVITPNLPEAEVLAGMKIRSKADLAVAAERIARASGAACVVKGGHLSGHEVIDVLYDEGRIHTFTSKRFRARATHGTGCTFSAALTAGLALGLRLPSAVEKAKSFVGRALANAQPAGRQWPLNLFGKSCRN